MTSPVDNPDPRSYEAAVGWAAIREAERVVERAGSGPTPMQRFTKSLFEQLDPSRSEES